MDLLEDKQKKFLFKVKKNFYFTQKYHNSIWYSNPIMLMRQFPKKTLYNIKDFLYSGTLKNCKAKNFPKVNKKYKSIIISWAFKGDFKSDGSFYSRYFNINSKHNPKLLWFTIYMDKEYPKKIASNIVLIAPFLNKKINFFFLIKNFVSVIFFLLRNLKIIFSKAKVFEVLLMKLSSQNILSKMIINDFKKCLNKNIKNVLITYEAIPFQSKIIEYLKKNKPQIFITGYIHAPPSPAPAYLMYNNSSPSKLIVNGKDQFNLFNKFLGWNKSKLKICKSNRHINKKNQISGNIFLPLAFNSYKHITSCLVNLIENQNIKNFNLKVRNHPSTANSLKHNLLSTKINNIINKQKMKNSKKPDFAIFIGCTSAIIEALEKNIKVFHISEDPKYDVYTAKFWPSLRVKKIDEYIYKYNLVKKNNILKFGKKPKNLNNFFNLN